MHPQSLSSNASEAIDKFSQDARLLFAELAELVNSMQSSSEADASSTAQHLALYLEAVTSLQEGANNAVAASEEMQQSCTKLYQELAAIDTLAKQVHELRQNVEKLEASLTAKLQHPPSS